MFCNTYPWERAGFSQISSVQCMAQKWMSGPPFFPLFNQTQICNTRAPTHSLRTLLPPLSMVVEALAPPHCVGGL